MTSPTGPAREHGLAVLGWAQVVEALAERCESAAGARAARALLPDLGRAEALTCLAETGEMQRLLEKAPVPVGGVREVEGFIDAAARGQVLGGADLRDVARSLEALCRLRAALASTDVEAPLVRRRGDGIVPQPALVEAVDGAIDPRGNVREDATPELVRLHRRKAELAARLERLLDSMRRDHDVAGALTDDYVTVRDGRWVLPVRSDRRMRVPGILHGRSASGHSLFVEPAAAVDLNNDLRSTEMDVDEEILRILRDLSARIGREAGTIRASLAEHAALDLTHARALLADRLGAALPHVAGDGVLDLRDLAHPLLLLRPGVDARAVVRNDVRLAPPVTGLVISGPNTGGKTVLLEAVGLACLMVRAGLMPCCREESRVPLFDGVFADVGDEQSLARSLSSFSAHLANVQAMLDEIEAGPGRLHLVLLDELMAGTDPVEGAALAQALLERLAGRDVRVIVTTHDGTLKAFAAASDFHRNAGMEVDRATLRPTYGLRDGVPGASAAFAAAERLGLPPDLLARARQVAGGEVVRADALLADLERARAEAVDARREAEEARAEAQRLEREQARLLAEARAAESSSAREDRGRLEKEIGALRSQAAAITRELQARPSLPAAAEAIRRLDELRASVRAAGAAEQARGHASADLVPGGRVRSASLGRAGMVVEVPDDRGLVRVAFDRVTVQLRADDLTLADGVPTRRPASSRQAPKAAVEHAAATPAAPGFTPQTPGNSVDLRGLRVEAALAEASRFLLEAQGRGETVVLLIHGHGTGALKAAVRDALRDDGRVDSFREGGAGEGGDGVTVVRLRT